MRRNLNRLNTSSIFAHVVMVCLIGHTHPGRVFLTVRAGTLSDYVGDNPICPSHVVTAGTGAIKAVTSKHIHKTRNETSSVAEALVTCVLSFGANPFRTDLPDPGTGTFEGRSGDQQFPGRCPFEGHGLSRRIPCLETLP